MIDPKLEEHCKAIVQQARRNLEQDGHLDTVAFVGDTATGQIIPIALQATSDVQRGQCARLIQTTAATINADFVFMVSEDRELAPQQAHRHSDILRKHGSIGASPYPAETVYFTLETQTGAWIAPVRVQPHPLIKNRRTFREVTFRKQQEGEVLGPYSGCLPRATPRGTMH